MASASTRNLAAGKSHRNAIMPANMVAGKRIILNIAAASGLSTASASGEASRIPIRRTTTASWRAAREITKAYGIAASKRIGGGNIASAVVGLYARQKMNEVILHYHDTLYGKCCIWHVPIGCGIGLAESS